MAEALGVAASIIAVATAGFQVAQALYQIADGIGGAGHEVRVYAKEIDVFSKVLNSIRNGILRPGIQSNELSLVKDITDICEDVLAPLNRIRKTLESLLERYRDSKKKMEQLKQRIHWYFSERNKLLFYREALRGHQQNLDTILAAMNFAATRDIMNKVALQNALLEGKMLPNDFSGGQSYLHSAFDAQSKQEAISSVPSNNKPAEENGSTSIQEEASHAIVEVEDVTDNPTAVVLATAASEEQSEPLSEDELRELDRKIDRDLDPDQGKSARAIVEDIRSLSRKAKKFAEGVLRDAETGVEGPSSAADASTLGIQDPVPVRRSSDEAASQDSEAGPDQGSISFQDTWGETWELPLKEAMVSMIQRIYTYTKDLPDHKELEAGSERRYHVLWEHKDFVKAITAALEAQSFVLRGPSGQIILPELWQSTIRSGWRVILRFHDISLNFVDIAEELFKLGENIGGPHEGSINSEQEEMKMNGVRLRQEKGERSVRSFLGRIKDKAMK